MDEVKSTKKKKSHFFETYILKVLKQIVDNGGITSNAKQQINSVLCMLVKYISTRVLDLTILLKKKTITDKEIENILNMTLTGELLSNSLSEGLKAVNSFKNFKNSENTVLYKQNKASIIFSPSLVEKFLRQFGYVKIMVSSTAPIYLAAVLEYITYEILDLSNNICRDNKRVRINIRDIELTIRNDQEINALFTRLNISLLGGGVIPFIHSSLLNKVSKKCLKHNNENVNRRFHSGTVAIRNIRKQQKYSDSLIFTRTSFEQFVRHIFKENKYNEDVKISKNVFIVLQYFIEQYITNILKNANFLAIHAGRIKLTPVDIGLISFLQNKSNNPYFESIEETVEIFSLSEESPFEVSSESSAISDEI